MTDEEFWLPLVDEPIGELVAQIQEDDLELGALASSPRRQLAFRIVRVHPCRRAARTLLVDTDVDTVSKSTWVEQLLTDPKNRAAVEEEGGKAVGREVAAGPSLPTTSPSARMRTRASASAGSPAKWTD